MATEVETSAPNGNIDGSVNQCPKTFQERLNEVPLYTVTWSQICAAYVSVKERNDVLKQAFQTGELFVSSLATSAKPMVSAAAASALKIAKPVVGEVDDPVGKIDSAASRALANAEKKFPIITQTPAEIIEKTKAAIRNTASSYVEKLQGSTPGLAVNAQVENVVSISELLVEMCFPTQGGNVEDLAEIEQAEEDEDKGVIVRVQNLGSRVRRRGARKVMSLKPVKVTVDAVHYAQEKILEMNAKLAQGTNYLSSKAVEAKELVHHKVEDVESTVQKGVADTTKLVQTETSELLRQVYTTSLYIPSKALEMTGEVIVSTRDIIFSYTKAHAVSEVPHAVVDMMEKYFSRARQTLPGQVTDVAGRAVAFVVVPAQVITEYVMGSRPVQWILPNVIQADEIRVVEDISMEEIEGDLK